MHKPVLIWIATRITPKYTDYICEICRKRCRSWWRLGSLSTVANMTSRILLGIEVFLFYVFIYFCNIATYRSPVCHVPHLVWIHVRSLLDEWYFYPLYLLKIIRKKRRKVIEQRFRNAITFGGWGWRTGGIRNEHNPLSNVHGERII